MNPAENFFMVPFIPAGLPETLRFAEFRVGLIPAEEQIAVEFPLNIWIAVRHEFD